MSSSGLLVLRLVEESGEDESILFRSMLCFRSKLFETTPGLSIVLANDFSGDFSVDLRISVSISSCPLLMANVGNDLFIAFSSSPTQRVN